MKNIWHPAWRIPNCEPRRGVLRLTLHGAGIKARSDKIMHSTEQTIYSNLPASNHLTIDMVLKKNEYVCFNEYSTNLKVFVSY